MAMMDLPAAAKKVYCTTSNRTRGWYGLSAPWKPDSIGCFLDKAHPVFSLRRLTPQDGLCLEGWSAADGVFGRVSSRVLVRTNKAWAAGDYMYPQSHGKLKWLILPDCNACIVGLRFFGWTPSLSMAFRKVGLKREDCSQT